MLSRRKIHACTLHLKTQQQRPLMADCHSHGDWKGRGLFSERRAVGRTVIDTSVFGSIVASGMRTSKNCPASLPQCPSCASLCTDTGTHFLSVHAPGPGRIMPPDVVINMLSSADKSRQYSASKTQQQRPSMAGLSQTRSGKGLGLLQEREGSGLNGDSCGHIRVF